jgi:ABC-type glycerol-3-phosphate transport system permease component
MGRQRTIRTILVQIGLVVISLVMLFPILWMIAASLKPDATIFDTNIFFIPLRPSLEAYRTVFEAAPIWTWLKNSLLICTLRTALETTLAVLAAFAFARFEFKGKKVLFYFILATMLLPPQAMILPMYITIDLFGFVNTFAGVIIPFAASGYCIFLLRQAFLKIPRELVESSEIDGCGPVKSLFYIYLPMSTSIITALAVILFTNSWNEYYWTWLVLSERSKFTMPVAATFFQNDLNIQYAPTMAVAALATLPILLLYIVAQKKFMEGLASSGLKG